MTNSKQGTGATKRPPSPQSSMTLSISQDDAQRMIEASRVLNHTLRKMQSVGTTYADAVNKENDDGSSDVRRVVSSSSDGSSEGSEVETKLELGNKTGTTTQLYELVTDAATACGDALIGSFLSALRERGCTASEIQTSLLLFLDMDKSAKLMTAFRVLQAASDSSKMDLDGAEGVKSSPSATKQNLSVNLKGAQCLFKFFLTAISSCIQTNAPPSEGTVTRSNDDGQMKPAAKAQKQTEQSSPNSGAMVGDKVCAVEDAKDALRSSPSFDKVSDIGLIPDAGVRRLPEATQEEIEEISTYASQQLEGFVKKKNPPADESTLITFETFGDWYNSGGYQIVPWLELLDLAKWDMAGRQETKSHRTKQVGPAIKEEPTTAPVKPFGGTSHPSVAKESPLNFFIHEGRNEDKILVTYDFAAAAMNGGSPLSINVTEDNLVALKTLVHRTGISSKSPSEVIASLQRYSKRQTVNGVNVLSLDKTSFGRCVRDLVPASAAQDMTSNEMEQFSSLFNSLFTCYVDANGASQDSVNTKELAIGFSILCSGNKSSKLVAGFDLIAEKSGSIDDERLVQYLKSYLMMLIGVSLLSPTAISNQAVVLKRQTELMDAVDSGIRWTLTHFRKSDRRIGTDKYSFENFASWYTQGGYNVAPWLELLDLKKLLALLGEPEKTSRPQSTYRHGQMSSPRRRPQSAPYAPIPPEDILFTFPLANERSLIVLREDATYVRSVVEKLGLLTLTSDDVWKILYKNVKSRPAPPPQPWSRTRQRKPGSGKSMDVDQSTFVRCTEEIIHTNSKGTNGRKRQIGTKGTSISETLVNFFQSFDLEQIDRVALNQLMGGLSLLCGGKKSTKLAFAFGLFDCRKELPKSSKAMAHSLDGEELFLFLRSFLIVMFSCCRQSLDMTAEAVGRYISDTAHMVAEDVMRYQWHAKKRDRVDFDEFGEWYNEGGFETAPWLELLDLKKWVLTEDAEKVESHHAPEAAPVTLPPRLGLSPGDPHYCPPPPPDGAFDDSFLDENTLMPMDSIDEMDFILMQQPSEDKENDGNTKSEFRLAYSPNRRLTPRGRKPSNSLKFHLVTHDEEGGYVMSVSQKRVRHLREILVESGLAKFDAEEACRIILSKAKKHGRGRGSRLTISKNDFDSAMRSIVGAKGKNVMSVTTQMTLSDILSVLFSLFDRKRDGRPDALQVACGFTLLCKGKKSDKLEHAFEVLDLDKDGKLTRSEMANYLESFLCVLLGVATSSHLEEDGAEDSFLYMNGRRIDSDPAFILRAAKSGAEWAVSQAWKGHHLSRRDAEDALSFDDFADWYTRKGFGNIPWLELLDLRKWVFTSNEDR